MHPSRRPHPLLALIPALALLLAACGGGSDPGATPDGTAVVGAPPATAGDTTTTPPAEAPPTAWDALLADLPDDGSVPLDAALVAFSLAYGPLPGVDVPAGELGEIEATSAMVWLAGHADELTPEQADAAALALSARHADGRLVEAAPAGPSRRAVTSPGVQNHCYVPGVVALTADADGAAPYRPVLDDAIRRVEEHLGPLGVPAWIGFADLPANTLADASSWAPDCSTTSQGCTIRIATHMTSRPADDVLPALLHEVVHCFQTRVVPIRGLSQRPRWIIEGFPTWVGEELADHGPGSNWWTVYLTTPEEGLFARTYDALGLWAELDQLHVDPWSTFAPGLLAQGNVAALTAIAGAAHDDLLTSWAASFARAPERGSAWDITGPYITADRYAVPEVDVADGGALVVDPLVPGANSLQHVTMLTEVVVPVLQAGGWRISVDGGAELLLEDVSGSPLCGSGTCECPADTPGAGTVFQQLESASFLLAVTGLEEPASASLEGFSLDDFCGQPVPTTTAPPAVEECLVGVWITDTITVPGYVSELTESGGAGAVLIVERDGTVTYDFDPMGTMSRYDDQLDVTFETASFGVATGHITAQGGVATVLDLDTSGTSHSLTAGPVHTELPAGPSAYVFFGSGRTYTCEGDVLTLSFTEPISGTPMQVLFGRDG